MLGLYSGLLVGGLYWLWMAARLGSILMFVVGLLPPAYVVATSVGLYSIVFGPPHWVSSYFGHAEQHALSEETKNAYTQSCSANLLQQGLALDKGKVFCRCTIDKVEAQFSGIDFEDAMRAQPNPNGTDIQRRLYRVFTDCAKEASP